MKIYVGNLPFDTTEDELRELFSEHGPVEDVQLITDRMTGRPRGFAFVEMGSEEAADVAIRSLNGKEISGRPLTVSKAQMRGTHGAGGGIED